MASGSHLLVFGRSKEKLFCIDFRKLADGACVSFDEDLVSLSIRRGEHLKDIFVPRLPVTGWHAAILTNHHLVAINSDLKVVDEIHLDQGRIVGLFGHSLVLQDSSHLCYWLPGGSLKSPVKMVALESTNERIVDVLADRIVVAHGVLDGKTKEAKIDLLQRHLLNAELLLAAHAFANDALSGKLVETIVSIFWESSFSQTFMSRLASRSCSRIDVEMVHKFGGLEVCFEGQLGRDSNLPSDVLEYLSNHGREYLETATDQAIKSRRLNTLIKLSILPPDIGIEEAISKLRTSESRLHPRLKKREVAFGSEVYR